MNHHGHGRTQMACRKLESNSGNRFRTSPQPLNAGEALAGFGGGEVRYPHLLTSPSANPRAEENDEDCKWRDDRKRIGNPPERHSGRDCRFVVPAARTLRG